MVDITITIPDNQVTRVTDAFNKAYPNMTPKQAVIQHIIQTVRNVEESEAIKTVEAQVEASLEADVTLS